MKVRNFGARRSRIKLFGLIFWISVWFFTAVACRAIVDSPSGLNNDRDSCFSHIRWNDRSFRMGDLIGHGKTGYIFTLQEEGKVASDKIAKIIRIEATSSIDDALKIAREEPYLAREFAGLFVPTWFYRINTSKSPEGTRVYRATLIKDRINGLTLHEVSKRLAKGMMDPVKIYKDFKRFKDQLIHKMMTQSRVEIYLWDLHANNIMYDLDRETWMIVDANREQGLDVFKRSLSLYYYERPVVNDPLSALRDLLDRYEQMPRRQFFEEYLAIYWKKYEDLLQLLQASKE